MNKTVLFSVVLLITGSNIGAMNSLCKTRIVLKSWQKKERLQRELASVKGTLELLDERE